MTYTITLSKHELSIVLDALWSQAKNMRYYGQPYEKKAAPAYEELGNRINQETKQTPDGGEEK